jgi:hypothetical protein
LGGEEMAVVRGSMVLGFVSFGMIAGIAETSVDVETVIGLDCCTAVEEPEEAGVGTETESERDAEPEPDVERVEYPLDNLETRFLLDERRSEKHHVSSSVSVSGDELEY